MVFRRFCWLGLVGLALLCSPAIGGKGGKGGKGKPGGGDPPTPADPVLVLVESGAIAVADADGGNPTYLVEDALVASPANASPCWSPDGAQIAFVSQDSRLTVVNVDGSGLTAIFAADDRHSPSFPAWSPAAAPDGSKKIAFTRGADNADGTMSNEIWLINPDGTDLQNLTLTPDRAESHPAWSPDGTKIAVFYQDLETTVDGRRIVTARGLLVFHLAAGTGEPIEIAATDAIFTAAADSPKLADLDWARTQDKIVCRQSLADDNSDLFVIDLATASQVRLTSTLDLDEYSPSWSPDDSEIVFQRHGYGKFGKQRGIHVMAPDGSGVTSLGLKDGKRCDRLR